MFAQIRDYRCYKRRKCIEFSVEYVGRYKRKETATEIDIEVEEIDTKELMESGERLEKITDYILANHNKKTHNRKFTAMFAVNGVKTAIKYYDFFQKKKQEGKHDLRIATIFSYEENQDDAATNGIIPEGAKINVHSREKLDQYIIDYNKMFGTKFSTKSSQLFYNYYNDISKKVKDRKIDILLVVKMFLTGFDSTSLNTLYVDKNLKYHGLIQAYSRTNRILKEQKSQGNIVVFRNLKKATDEAITLFSNKEAIEVIIMKPYDEYAQQFNKSFVELIKITPTVNSVDELISEDDELMFIKAFRQIMRVKNILTSFSDFKWGDLSMNEQLFEDYKSKYLDLWQKVKSNIDKERVSILDDVDFELELIHRDEINVNYIINLLVKLKSNTEKDEEKIKQEISNFLNTEVNLRSKRELIRKFIEENLPRIEDADDIPKAFEVFWNEEQEKAFKKLIKEENLSEGKTQKLIENYLYVEREPLRDEVLDLIQGAKPSVLKRKKLGDKIMKQIINFVETFTNGITGN